MPGGKTLHVREDNVDFHGATLLGVSGLGNCTADVIANRPGATGSKNYYFATDDLGGTLYFDDPNGGGAGVAAWRLINTPGREIASAELIGNSGNSTGTGMTTPTSSPTISFAIPAGAATRTIRACCKGRIQNTLADAAAVQVICQQAQNGYSANSYLDQDTIPAAAMTAATDHPFYLVGPMIAVPGVTYSFTVQIAAPSTGTTKLVGANNFATGKRAVRLWAELA